MRFSIPLALPAALLIQVACSVGILAPAVAAPALLPALGLGTVAIGVHMTVLFLAAIFSVQYSPALIGRLGPIRASQWALLTSACGLVLVGLPHLVPAVLGTVLIGLGSGPILPASAELITRSVPPERYALAFSVKQTGVPLGGILVALVVPAVLVRFNGFIALCIVAGLSLLAAGAAQGFRASMDQGRDPHMALPRLMQLLQPVQSVFANPALRPLGWLGLALAVAQFSLNSYLVTYLTLERGWTIVAAGFALAVAQACGVVGRVAWGGLADTRLGDRKTCRLMVLSMGAASLGMPWMPEAAATVMALVVCALFGATAIGWSGLFFAIVARVAPPGQVATATAGVTSFNYFGVVIGPAIFGLVAQALGSHANAYALLGLGLVVLAFSAFRAGKPDAH